MSTVRLKFVGLALIAALGASAAHAQRGFAGPGVGENNKVAAAVKAAKAGQTGHSRVDIQQQGRDNGAAVGQTGAGNGARINQNGIANTGQVSQTGTNNSGTIYQIGRGNEGAITQTGDNNNACLVQLGNNNSAGITQTGDQSIGIAQNKARTWEFPAELCQTTTDPYFLRRAVRAAW